jgi:spore maturation protein B
MSAVAILAAAGSRHPTAIVGTAFLATVCSTVAAIWAVKWLERRREFAPPAQPVLADNPFSDKPPSESLPPKTEGGIGPGPLPRISWIILSSFCACFILFFLGLTFGGRPGLAEGNVIVRAVNAIAVLAIPFLASFFPLHAMLRGIAVYEEFVEGAKEGFQVGVRIIPYLVAMLVAIAMFRGGGGIELLTKALQPVLSLIGFPAELLPLSLVRPLSGSASIALLSDLAREFGGDHLFSRMAGTILGSTETTFYVIAVYFGAVNVRRTRHAVPAGLFADFVGILASVIICRLVWA